MIRTPKFILQIAVVSFLALLIFQVSQTFGADEPITILPLGDSITQGENQGRSTHNSYRRALWQMLQSNGYANVDFVGSWDVAYPNQPPANPDFDMDHEGHWGWYAEEIINGCNGCPASSGSGKLADWLQGYTPDIVLLHIGSNDLKDSGSDTAVVAQTIDEIGQIIDLLRVDNPDVTILLAQLIPSTQRLRAQRVPLLNAEIPLLAANKTQANSPVIVVDQFTGFSAINDTYDGTHPNEAGEQKMAEGWFEALMPLLNDTPTATSTSTPPVTPTLTTTAASTATSTSTLTATVTSTVTTMPTATSTSTATATSTVITMPTATSTSTAPATATVTTTPTATFTSTATATSTSTAIATPTATATSNGSLCNAATVLFVGDSQALSAPDQSLVNRLVAQGHEVVVRGQNEVVSGDADGKDLIIISDSINSRSVGSTFTNVAVPVMIWEAGLYDDMKLTGSTVGVDYNYINNQTQLKMVDSTHPLAGGLAEGTVTVLTAPRRFYWGVPAADAITVATLAGDASRSAIFAYEAGDTMVGLTAPARRVAFFNGDGPGYNEQAWQLYDAAIVWALGCEEPVTVASNESWSLFDD